MIDKFETNFPIKFKGAEITLNIIMFLNRTDAYYRTNPTVKNFESFDKICIYYAFTFLDEENKTKHWCQEVVFSPLDPIEKMIDECKFVINLLEENNFKLNENELIATTRYVYCRYLDLCNNIGG